MKKNFAAILPYIVSLMFLISGVSKIIGIMAFEHLLVSKFGVNWWLVPFISRIIISSEIIAGLGLIIDKSNRKFYTLFSLVLLSAFSIYLIFDLISVGNSGNCGCFGEVLPLNTVHSVLKNILFIFITLIIYFRSESPIVVSVKHIFLIAILSISLIFVVKPMAHYKLINAIDKNIASHDSVITPKDSIINLKLAHKKNEEQKSNSDTIKKPIVAGENLESKYPARASGFAQFGAKALTPVNIDYGEKIVAVFSLDCDHCQATAKELVALKSKFNLPEILILFLGENEQVNPFFAKAGGSFNYLLIEPEMFFPLLKKNPPRVLYLINGNLMGDWEGEQFNIELLKNTVIKLRQK